MAYSMLINLQKELIKVWESEIVPFSKRDWSVKLISSFIFWKGPPGKLAEASFFSGFLLRLQGFDLLNQIS